MPKRLIWDAVGEKFYEMGTKMGVLYPMNDQGSYDNGVAWNGLTAVTESPSGAEETKLYADDIKYASLRSAEGNDVTDEVGQKIHIAWNSTASPSEKSYATINDSPDAITFSWECSASPVNVTGHRPSSHMEIDCSKLKEKTVKAIEDKLWGSETADATLPTPDELIQLITTSEAAE